MEKGAIPIWELPPTAGRLLPLMDEQGLRLRPHDVTTVASGQSTSPPGVPLESGAPSRDRRSHHHGNVTRRGSKPRRFRSPASFSKPRQRWTIGGGAWRVRRQCPNPRRPDVPRRSTCLSRGSTQSPHGYRKNLTEVAMIQPNGTLLATTSLLVQEVLDFAYRFCDRSRESTSSQRAFQSRRSGSGSCARAWGERRLARSVSTFQWDRVRWSWALSKG